MTEVPARQMLGILPDPYVRGVGLVITQWAWVEGIVDQFIWRLLGVRALRGRIVTSNLLARGKIETLAALMRKSRMEEKLIKEIESRGYALAAARNLVAHAYIAVPPKFPWGLATSYSARGGALTDRGRLVTPEALENVAIKIAAFLLFLTEKETRFPRQRGLRPRQEPAVSKPLRRRFDTMLQRLPPLLEVDLAKVTTGAEMEAARAAKRAAKQAHRARSAANRKPEKEPSKRK